MADICNITCDQGSTFSRVLTHKDASTGALVNLTGYTARMQVRAVKAVSSPQLPATVELTTENGRIVLGGAAGTVTLKLSATATAAIAAGTYYYDLELVSAASPQVTTRMVQGTFTVDQEVTR